MRFILLFLFVVIIISVFSYLGGLTEVLNLPGLGSEKPQEETQPKTTQTKTVPKSTGTASVAGSLQPEPNFLIDTFITEGPDESEIIEDNKVVFEWDVKVYGKETDIRISFETKLEGHDEKWISTSYKKRTITSLTGPKEYTFLVRAKTKDGTEPSPAQRNFKINISPYFGKIKIYSAQKATGSQPSLITLNTSLQENERINITGWKLESKKGIITIPFGIENYEHYYSLVPLEDIFIKRGDTVYLSSAKNPLGQDRNFRPNKCFGWLEVYYDFPVSVPATCPKPEKEDYSHLDVCCRELINKTSGCKMPNYSADIKTAIDQECVSYILQNFNYLSCYNSHFRDEDFIKNNWHIYLNRDILAVDQCDTLYLRDQNGLVVDFDDYGRDVCK